MGVSQKIQRLSRGSKSVGAICLKLLINHFKHKKRRSMERLFINRFVF